MVNWIVLDGLTPYLIDPLLELISGDGLTLKNGEKLLLPKSCQLIVESTALDFATPSLLSTVSLIHFSGNTITYNTVIDTWLDRAPTQHNLSAIR